MLLRKNRLILRVHAGLGNQQIQYVVAKKLAHKYKRNLVLDTTYFLPRYLPISQQEPMYPYMLNKYNIKEEHTRGLLKEYIGIVCFNRRILFPLVRIQNIPFFSWFLPKILTDNNFDEKCFKESKRDILMCGYFQKINVNGEEKNNEFSFKKHFRVSGKNKKYLTMSRLSNTVGMHIRRGDYVNNTFYEQLQMSYYEDALNHISSMRSIDNILVITDGVEWAKENCRFNYPVTFIVTDGPDYDHQYIMSQCSAIVIANSTYSYVAAAYFSGPSKIVVAPMKWFSEIPTNEIITLPESWHLIEN